MKLVEIMSNFGLMLLVSTILALHVECIDNKLGPFHLTDFGISNSDRIGYFEVDSPKGTYTARSSWSTTYLRRWYPDDLQAASNSQGSITISSLTSDPDGKLVLAAKLESDYLKLGKSKHRIEILSGCQMTSFIAVLNSALTVEWSHALCSVYVTKAVASDGGVLIAGAFLDSDIWKPFIAKYAASGLVWKHQGTMAGYTASLAVGPDNSSYWLGNYHSGPFQILNLENWSLDEENSVFLARIDSNGRILWLKAYGGPKEDRRAFDVVVDQFHNLAVISNSSQLNIERIHRNGSVIASYYYSGDIRNAFGAMDGYNQLFIVGNKLSWTQHENFRQKVFYLKISGDEIIEEQNYGSDSSNILCDGISYTNGKLIIFGRFNNWGSLDIGGFSAEKGRRGAFSFYSRVLCPLHFQPSASSVCEPCPGGTFTLDGTRNTCGCKVGYECGNTWKCSESFGFYDKKCITCPSGSYKPISANTTCLKCPENSACTPSSFLCEPGYTLAGDSCEKCATNTSKPNYGNEPCLGCGENALCDGTNSFCKAGYEPWGDECRQCLPGKYKTKHDNSSCIECPDGALCDKYRFTCKSGFYLKDNQCQGCPVGTFKTQSGNVSCTSCPTNSFCQSTGFECDKGYKRAESSCEACTNGTYKPEIGNGQCLQCPSGAICYGSSYECDKGYEMNNGECTQCQTGFYKLEKGNLPCSLCPINSICSSEGFMCRKGHGKNGNNCEKCTESYNVQEGNHACTSCPEGAICSGTSVTCQAGYEPDGLNRCKRCSENSYKLSKGNYQCRNCPTYAQCTPSSLVCKSGYEPSGNECKLCDQGYIKLNSGNSSCDICPHGATCQDSESFTCAKGYYLSESKCVKCANGTYKDRAGDNSCVQCPENSICTFTGYWCSIGHEPNEGKCTKCGENSYKNQAGNFNCLDCPLGADCTESSFTCLAGYEMMSENYCGLCQQNFIKLESGNHKCVDCRPGTDCYTKLNGNGTVGSAQFCEIGFEPSGNSCARCRNGYFKSNVGNSSCLACPSNSICNFTYFTCKAGYGESAEAGCKRCADGQTKFFDGNYPCHDCYEGQICSKDSFTCDIGYEPDPNEGSRCRPCADGKFKSNAGNSMCSICPENAVCDQKSVRCNDGLVLLDGSCLSPPSERDESGNSDSTLNQPAGEVASSFSQVGIIASIGTVVGLIIILAGIVIRKRRVNRFESIDYLNPPRRNPIAEIFGTLTNYKPLNETLSRSLGNFTTTIAHNSEMSIPIFLKMLIGSDFDLGDLIGDGGFGKIYDCNIYSNELLYRANDSELVFKYVKNSVDSLNEVESKLFFQEIAVMWKLRSSDQFVHLNGFCEEPAGLLMKKYIAGDLENLIYWKTDLSIRFPYTKLQMVNLIRQISKGVKFMHDNNIVHCDLKPSNVFLDVDKTRTKLVAVIADFGLCRVVDPASVEVSAFRIADFNGASLLYAAPEAISRIRTRKREYNGAIIMASDTYSLGLTFMEMITRKRPWF